MNPIGQQNPFSDPTLDFYQTPRAEGLDPYRTFFAAKITLATSVAGIWNYGWKEQSFNSATGVAEDANPRREGGVGFGPALELNNASVAVGTVVFMKQKGIVNGQVYYEFAARTGLTSYSANRSADYTIVADDTWEDVTLASGATFPLPTAGEYLLTLTATATALVSALGGTTAARVMVRLYDATAATVVPGGTLVVCAAQAVNVSAAQSASLSVPYGVNVLTGIKLQAYRMPGPTWTFAGLYGEAGGPGGTRLSSLKYA